MTEYVAWQKVWCGALIACAAVGVSVLSGLLQSKNRTKGSGVKE